MNRKLLLILMSLVCGLQAAAYDFPDHTCGLYFNVLDDSNAAVTYNDYDDPDYGTYSGSITIPSTAQRGTLSSTATYFTVKEIGESAFRNCYDLTYVYIPNTVTAIRDYAFLWCTSLSNVSIPSSVTTIGAYAFGRCENFTYISIPSSVTTIGESAFSSCSKVTSIYIPSSVTSIGSYAFSYCSKLPSVTLPSSLTTIPFGMFYECTSLTNVTILGSVTSIYGSAFYDCPGSMTITCNALTPPSITSTTFMSDHYSNATVVVPGPGSLALYKAADYWKNFANIVAAKSYDFVVNGIYYNVMGSNTVKVTCKDSDYNSYSGSVTIPSSVTYNGRTYQVTAIGDYAFKNSPGLTSVSIPNTITSIGEDAFYNCSGLTNVTIPNSVTSMGRWAFDGCSGLLSVNISTSLTSLRDYVFFGCSSLKEVTIPASVTSIGYRVFYNCYDLERVTMPSSLTSIGDGVFTNCSSLKSVTCLATTPPSITGGTFMSSQYSSATLFVPKSSMSNYQSATYWKNFTSRRAHLNYALNTGSGTIEFTSTGDFPWTNVVEGSRVYAISGNAGRHSTTSTLSATVSVSGASTLSFDFKAWGEGTGYDVCIFYVDGTQKFSYGARQNNWETYTMSLAAGTHTLTWRYSKDSSVNPTGDYFAVDNVVISVDVIRGDVNGDGSVSIADVTALIDYLLTSNASGINLQNADCNNDHSVTIADVTALIDFLLTGYWS